MAISPSISAASMNFRDETIVVTWAAVQAAAMFRAPVEKFSMAGTRPKACRPKSVSNAPMALGRRTPTVFCLGVSLAILRPRMKLPMITRL